MTSSIEINNMGETIKIVITESTTASDVVGIVNDMWPGTARLISEMGEAFQVAMKSVEELAKEQKREQKHIDRIAWKAEAAQRRAKGGHWK